jgi:glycosyltransferase involved in cell wall biosynthesis
VEKSIAIIIPALNEAATIADVVGGAIAMLARESFSGRVYVVDDGSDDRTAELARAAGATVISHAVNMGVGRAFRSGLAEALRSGADIVVNIDADGQFDPARIPDLVAPILNGRADFTSASRFKDPELVPNMPKAKLIGNLLMSRLISRIAGKRYYDVSCGFRAYNREAALHLNLWGAFTYTQESILDLVIKGLRIEEVPMKIRGVRGSGKSKVASNLWAYGFKALKIILHTYRDYWPSRFFGWLSLPFLATGAGLVVFLFIHRFASGHFSPHIWAGFTGGGLFGLGVLILLTGLAGETLKRIRLNQEMLLYYHRRAMFDTPRAEEGRAG